MGSEADIGDQGQGAVVEIVQYAARPPKVERAAALALERDAHVFQHGEMGEYGRNLKRAHEAEPRHIGRRQGRDVFALVDDAAVRGLEKLGEQIEARGLAGAVRADQGMYGAARDLQVDAAYGHEPGEVFGEILGLEDDLRAHQLFPWAFLQPRPVIALPGLDPGIARAIHYPPAFQS